MEKKWTKNLDSREKFNNNIREINNQAVKTRVSPTGYTDNLLGMDDLYKIRCAKTEKKVV